MWTVNFLMYKLVLEKAEEQDITCLENPKDRRAWWAAVYGVAQSWTRLKHLSKQAHTSKVMLKIPHAMLQRYVNCELPDVQAGFRKGRGTRDQIANSIGSSKKQESSRKTSTSSSLTVLKSLTVWITTNWKIPKEMGISDHLTFLLRNLYAGQEAS